MIDYTNFLLEHQIIIPTLVGFIFGEEIIALLVLFYLQNKISLVYILFFSLLGLLASDCFLFYLGKKGIANKLHKYKKFESIYRKVDNIIVKITRDNVFVLFLLTKYINGFALISLIYLGDKNIRWWRFLRSNLVSNIILVLIAFLLGYSYYLGFTTLLSIFKNLQLVISLTIVLILIIIIFKKWITKKIKTLI